MRTTYPVQILRRSIRLSDTVQDCLFVSAVVVLSAIVYVPYLGFYSDDWWFLAGFRATPHHSLLGFIQSLYDPTTRQRPVQVIYLAGLYWLFGLHPLGYHLVNTGVFLSGIVLFYLVLRELGLPRSFALAVPIVYALLPHYSTDRFWFAAFQANLCMALYFLSLYADIRVLRAQPRRVWRWMLLGIVSLFASVLAYEMFLPLFLLNPLLVWYRGRQLSSSAFDTRAAQTKTVVLLGRNLIAVIAVTLFKVLVTIRLQQFSFVEQLGWFAHLIQQAFLSMAIGDYGLRLPRVLWIIFTRYFNVSICILGALFGLVIFGYQRYIADQAQNKVPSRNTLLVAIVLGLVVLELGYAVIPVGLIGYIIPIGMNNRTGIASAVGIALVFVGLIGWVCSWLPSGNLQRVCFYGLISLLCVSGFLINTTLATFWITAYRQDQAVLADIHQRIPTIPSGSTLLLDGVCPYVGPAVVFEAYWDLTGALRMLYNDPTLRADVVTPRMKIEQQGLSTRIYDEVSNYPYEQMYIYNYSQKKMYQFLDAAAAQRYFQLFNPDYSNHCPPSRPGWGVPAWGMNTYISSEIR